MIKYTQSKVADRPTFRTEKFGNLLSDTYQGEVEKHSDGTWSGWVFNHSDDHKTIFKLGFATKTGATRWVNAQLKQVGVE